MISRVAAASSVFEWVVAGNRRYLRQHGDAGVAIHEELADVVVRIEAIDEVHLAAPRLRERRQ